MGDYEAYQLGLIESIGDDVLGRRVPLTDVLKAVGADSAARWYAKGWAVGERYLTPYEVPF